MSSIGDEDIDDTIATFDPKIDGLLDAFRWSAYAQGVMRFAITTSDENYEDTRDGLIDDYPDDVHEDITVMPQLMVDGILRAGEEFERIFTFSFDNDQNAQNGARIRLGITSFDKADDDSKDAPAYAYTPDEDTGLTDQQNWISGDIFFNEDVFGTADPQVGTYAYHTILHEIGHAMGLKHGHETEEFEDGFVREALPPEWDSMEFAVMTYRSFIGAPTDSYKNPAGHYAQTLMMLDIAALQSQYGADYSTAKGNSVYTWDETGGSFFISGVRQWTPAADVVFMTIWDGGGVDTYDLSNYSTDIRVDLAPGGEIDFGTQLAALDVDDMGAVTQESRANVWNALLYQDDTRSLIEHATTGGGNDEIKGNVAFNRLDGGGGNDTLTGGDGDDTLTGGAGQDDINGGEGIDYAGYTAGTGVDVDIRRIGPAGDGAWSVTGFTGARDDDLRGIEGFIFGEGRDFITIRGAPEVDIYAGGGADNIRGGGGGGGVLVGGKGSDTITVSGDGVFEAYGGDLSRDGTSIGQRSQDDVLRIDLKRGDDAFFLTVINPNKLSEFFDGEGSTAEGFSRIGLNGTDKADTVDGGVGNDTLFGFGGGDGLDAHAGADSIDGGNGGDIISGGAGDDTILGGEGGDRIQGDEDNDRIQGGGGSDTIFGGDGHDRITTGGGGDFLAEGDAGNDTIAGDVDNETFFGDEGNDVLFGAGGKDILLGGIGKDTIEGGTGNDSLTGGGDEDRFIFEKGFGSDQLNDFDADARGGQDLLNIRAFGFDDFKDFTKAVTFTGSDDLTIKFKDGSVVRLFDISKGDLSGEDFLF